MINLGQEAVATPAASSLNLVARSSDGNLVVVDPSGNVGILGSTTTKSGRILSVATITATNAALTPPTAANAAYIECWGAGGQGGGAATSSSTASIGAGGGGGAYSAKFATGFSGNFNCTIGAGGTGGAAGAAGNAGGDTSVAATGITTVLAKGGGGGTVFAASASGGQAAAVAGGAAASATGADLAIDGGPGDRGHVIASAGVVGNGKGGFGGNAPLGPIGPAGVTTATGGTAGTAALSTQYGAGGGGAATVTTQQAGGVGGPGLIRITWMVQ